MHTVICITLFIQQHVAYTCVTCKMNVKCKRFSGQSWSQSVVS